jgi:hypothetical protein
MVLLIPSLKRVPMLCLTYKVKTSKNIEECPESVGLAPSITKVNLEGWWHPRQHVRHADGEENE